MSFSASEATLQQLIVETLKGHPGIRLAPKEIARYIIQTYPGRFREKERALGGSERLQDQLTREVYAHVDTVTRNNPVIGVDRSKKPMRLFFGDEEPVAVGAVASPVAPAPVRTRQPRPSTAPVDAEPPQDDPDEHSLYPLVIQFLREHLHISARRINEATSRNRRGRNGNKWLHPDIVGMEAQAQNWIELVRQCAMELPARKARLVSLEVKVRLTPATIRESFFQAVSNSLWANTAYLVATEVEGDDTLAELRMLCGLHGVGYIALDPETPQESRILIPAKVREEIDWASADRLARENADFQTYLDHVLNYLRTGKVVRGLWD
jgi:uncharacterized protein